MAKDNMFGAFGTSAEARTAEQSKIELAARTTGKRAPHQVAPELRKRGADGTTMTLTVSRADKDKIKLYAAHHSTTVSDLFHEWISSLGDEA